MSSSKPPPPNFYPRSLPTPTQVRALWQLELVRRHLAGSPIAWAECFRLRRLRCVHCCIVLSVYVCLTACACLSMCACLTASSQLFVFPCTRLHQMGFEQSASYSLFLLLLKLGSTDWCSLATGQYLAMLHNTVAVFDSSANDENTLRFGLPLAAYHHYCVCHIFI